MVGQKKSAKDLVVSRIIRKFAAEKNTTKNLSIYDMARFRSSKEVLDYIKKEFFNGNGLDGITEMSAEERLEFLLEKVNWALKEQDLAEWIGVQFWKEIYDDEDEFRRHRELDPARFFNQDSQLESFTEQEQAELAFLKELSAICFDLSILRNIDTTVLGWPKYEPLDYSCAELLDRVSDLADKLPNLAAYLSKAIYNHTIGFCIKNTYQPAQDHFAELYDMQYGYLMERIPLKGQMPRSAYSKAMMSEMRKFAAHISECRNHGMCLGAIIVHDTLYASLPDEIDEDVVNAAKKLWAYIDSNVEIDVEYFDTDTIFEEQPDEVVKAVRAVMGPMMKKVDEAYEEGGFGKRCSTDRLARAYFDDFGYRIICMKYDGDEEGLRRLRI